MNDTLDVTAHLAEPLHLDPFGSHPGRASRLPGLGGHEPSADPSYVFQTLHCRPAITRVRATICFSELSATHGTLVVQVLARSAFPGADSVALETKVFDIAELARTGGIVEVGFDSFRNALYAIAGSINDETDATASHISISVDQRATSEQHGKDWGWRSTPLTASASGPDEAMIQRLLKDLIPPTLEEPSSQVGSPNQCRQPAFASAMEALHRPAKPSFENWSLAYLLRAIDRFAPRKTDCNMLGYIGDGPMPLISYFAARQCEVLAMRSSPSDAEKPDPGAELLNLFIPELCEEDEFFAHAHFTAGDIRYPPPSFRDQFDIIWSIGANRVMTPHDFANFVVNGLSSAKPGGVAIHVFDYVEDVNATDTNCLTRNNIERMTTMALSHFNEVARLRFQREATPPSFVTPDTAQVLPFGIVIRRGGG
ncbi:MULTISPECIES: hypothetical protein [unclassified Novosphingobium]|uniref:hypothetical protein n=1 Tax=unclassified Novosphingobium TaxID=2644732 RepID=UPI00135984DE|nr:MULTISPECIES: hypothetical protein [unclassified Novosphingobium]